MKKTLAEIADLLNGEVVGDKNIVITGISGIKEAQDGDITFVANSKYIPLLEKTQASAIIAPQDLNISGKNIIKTENPSLAFANVASLIIEENSHLEKGIHNTAVIDKDAKIGENVTIGPNAVVESHATIGNNCIIGGGSFIGYRSTLGEGCLVYPNVTILNHSSIGKEVIVHSGTVIGSDGFGYIDVKGVHEKIPQIGIVEIHDHVEIGANVTIDRARFDKTIIGKGTKIDNLVQIAHNVIIGENCILCGQVGIAGSCTVEDNVVLAGQVGLAGHLTVGHNSIVASGSGVPSSIPPDSFYWGFPAKPAMQAKRVNAAVQRLPLYVKTINDLKKRIEDLESKILSKEGHTS